MAALAIHRKSRQRRSLGRAVVRLTERYFGTPRHDVLYHLRTTPRRALEIGCGTGATMAILQQRQRLEQAVGVELDPASAKLARQHFDAVIEGAVEQADFEALIAPGSLDLVLCLDVLEHLVDPWHVVRRVSPLLKPGGRLVVSVPNIRNWKFIWKLLTRGDFKYRDSGLLDRTHLRFFVKETALDLATAGGLAPVGAYDARIYDAFEFRGILNAVTFGAIGTLLAKQWIVIAERR